jgi:magnesium chelatase family protein
VGAALLGVEGFAVEVEARVGSQLPRVDMVGLPEAAVRESAARVRSAITAVGQKFPDRAVTVNLAPAERRKSGAGLDLPIAIAVLAAAGAVEPRALDSLALVGELALDGRLRPVRGALAFAIAAREAGCRRLIVPCENAREAALAPDLAVHAARDLREVLADLLGGERLPAAAPATPRPHAHASPDLKDVRGQHRARRALEIAAAGEHGIWLRGAPGAGKTMLARRLPGILPPLELAGALEVARIHGAAGTLVDPVVASRPFRAPHHTASTAGLLGGGNPPRPGEVSLAHRGVLFLDELPEFERRSLESLRQVVEARRVVIARAAARCVFPADFQLIAASNPCPCGWLGSGRRDCRCDDGNVARYASRVSGPLLDRIDLHVDVRPVSWHDLDLADLGTSSAEVGARVADAQRTQIRRAGTINARLHDGSLDAQVDATPDARRLLGRAVDGYGLSARGARRALRVARTIADLAGDARTGPAAIAEALSFRSDVGAI